MSVYAGAVVLVIILTACSSSIRFTSERVGNTEVRSSKYASALSLGNPYRGSKEYNENYNRNNASSLEVPVGDILSGKASFYSDSFDGEVTASGDTYKKNELTAAHQTLPFGTKVAVRNLHNNKTVVVVINDRGPFKGGRIIDLSYAAAERLDMLNDGVVDVEVKILK